MFEGSEKMPLQGVYGEYTPRSGAPQHSGSHSPCAGQCVTFRPARDHCDAAARLPRVRRHPPASRDHPARLEHGLPAHLPRESSRDSVRQRRARGKKKTAKAKRKVKEGAWEGKGHWTYLRLTADEEEPEKIEEIRRKMSS